ncbi:MAG: response regulator transcription factor [Proteobacteria bacterium]|nr:response regulator transcription factor [Pseudomonadota bacterium]
MQVLVVDDEPLVRMVLAGMLGQRADVTRFDLAENAQQALELLKARSYDVLLLDIQMPGLSGLQLVERLRADGAVASPAVVFITAYERHAVEAFEKRAVDYVLKPFAPARVHEALDVAAQRSHQERAARLVDLAGSLHLVPERPARIAIKDKGRIVFVDVRELASVEAHGNYVLLQQKSGSYLLRETLSGIADKLAPHGFIRVHRSALVNSAFVESIEPDSGGDYVLKTRTGRQYTVTRTYRDSLRSLAQFWIGAEPFNSG